MSLAINSYRPRVQAAPARIARLPAATSAATSEGTERDESLRAMRALMRHLVLAATGLAAIVYTVISGAPAI